MKLIGVEGLKPLPPPPEEAHLRGRRHSKERDAAAIQHHYDVSNEFYELVLGSTMTYSCAVFEKPSDPLDARAGAEVRAHLPQARPAARASGCSTSGAVGAAWRCTRRATTACGRSASRSPRRRPRRRASACAAAGLADRVEIRLLDYRDVVDGPYDAISSIGMFEHVGLAKLGEYFDRLRERRRARRPGAEPRHQPSAGRRAPRASRARRFIDRYVFPDGELHEVGAVVSAMQQHGLEVRHVEGPARALRAHAAALGREPRSELGRSRAARRRSAGRGSGASTWRRPRSTSRRASTRSTKCSPCGPTVAHRTCRLRPDWGA